MIQTFLYRFCTYKENKSTVSSLDVFHDITVDYLLFNLMHRDIETEQMQTRDLEFSKQVPGKHKTNVNLVRQTIKGACLRECLV